MHDDGLPPLRDVISKHGLRADKKFGQNFILDLNVTRRIARHAGDLTDCEVVEIGPGPGGLTRGLLMEGARKVHVIEVDSRFIPALQEIAQAYPDRLNIVEGDALQIRPKDLTDGLSALCPTCLIISARHCSPVGSTGAGLMAIGNLRFCR